MAAQDRNVIRLTDRNVTRDPDVELPVYELYEDVELPDPQTASTP